MNLQPDRRSLADCTTVRIGGWTDKFYEANTLEDLRTILCRVTDRSSVVVLGRGSNILFPKGRFDRPVLKLSGNFEEVNFGEGTVEAGAAVFFPALALQAAEKGLSGLEWAGGVPGSVGGAIAMNAGAFGTEIVDVLREVSFLNDDGVVERLQADRVKFDYRYCELRDHGLILSATFDLERTDSGDVMERTKSLLRQRRNEQPVGTSSAGCVFKNVDGLSAGKLIEDAGMKGIRRGDIEVSEQHANYFINHGKGTFEEMVALIEDVREAVKKESGYRLEPELQIVREG